MGIISTLKKAGSLALGIPIAEAAYDTVAGTAGTYTPANANAVYWGGSPLRQQARVDEYGRRLDEGYDASLGFEQAGLEGRGLERQTFDAYERMSRGEGPSLAAMQMRAGLDQAQQQAGQQAASVRGGAGNQLVAQRMAQQTGATLASQAAQGTSELRQREQLAAMGAMGDVASRMRGGDARAQELAAGRGRDFLGARQGVEGATMEAAQQRALADQEAANMANQQALASRREQLGRRQAIFEKAAGVGSKAFSGGVV